MLQVVGFAPDFVSFSFVFECNIFFHVYSLLVITDRDILTVAHCLVPSGVENIPVATTDVTVYADITNPLGPFVTMTVAQIGVHPKYNGLNYVHRYDMAVIQLTESVDPNIYKSVFFSYAPSINAYHWPFLAYGYDDWYEQLHYKETSTIDGCKKTYLQDLRDGYPTANTICLTQRFEEFHGGNEGGPVFFGEDVYGMIIGSGAMTVSRGYEVLALDLYALFEDVNDILGVLYANLDL